MSVPVEALEQAVPVIHADAPAPVVVIGNGPVGMQFAREMLKRDPQARLVIYGGERHPPYDRVRLSSLLAGDVAWSSLSESLALPPGAEVAQRLGCRVTCIDTARRLVIDEQGGEQPYRKLVIATGSCPYVPDLEGIDKAGVYTFRDMDDVNQLMARRVRSHHTVVLGAGLLGLEAARGMQRSNTRVTVVEHADRIMGQQLDEAGAQALASQVEGLGISLVVGDGVRRVLGRDRVEALELRSGQVLACDTLVVATGIRPNIELAQMAGIARGQGIRVDDAMQTSVADVYAIGECAEHRGHVYGLVAPGLEQAAVAAAHINGQSGHYQGSVAVTQLKVVGCPVFSVGAVADESAIGYGSKPVYRDEARGVYRALVIRRNRLVGAVGVGEWPDSRRLQIAVTRGQWILPWQRWRFLRSGSLWPAEDLTDASAWPASAPVCQCRNVTRGTISEAIGSGAYNVDRVTECTGAGGVCGSCRPLIQQLLGAQDVEPVPYWRLLLGSAAFSLLLALAFLLLPAIPYADSVQTAWRWDLLWRDGLLKQITGFTILGLFVLGLAISPRKRVRALQALGRFDHWRLLHVVLGVLVAVTLLLHTGLRLGSGMNLWLMLSFVGVLLLGALSTGVISLEHRIGGALAARLRRKSVWWHILVFWPVPVVLGFHILKTYVY